MKKILMLIICLIPLSVEAITETKTKEYIALIKNDTDIYEYSYEEDNLILTKAKQISKDTEIKITNELYYNNETYGYFNLDDTNYYIEIKNLSLKSNTYTGEKCKLDKEQVAYVFGSDVYLYNGPSKVYSKVTNEIPIDTKITYEYTDCSEVETNSNTWVYGKYNGKSGWLYIYPIDDTIYKGSSNVAKVSRSTIMTIEEVTEIYERPNKNSNKISVSIPKNIIIKYDYQYSVNYGAEENWVYITVNGKSGWINTEEKKVATEINGKGIVANSSGLTLYSRYQDYNSKLEKTLLINTRFTYKYRVNNWIYITYQGFDYWALLSNSDYLEEYAYEEVGLEPSNTKTIAISKINLYTNPTKDSKLLRSINANTELKLEYVYYSLNTNKTNYETWYYVVIDGTGGWIKDEFLGKYNNQELETFFGEVYIYKLPSSISEKVATIPIDKKIKKTYETYVIDITWSYVEYNGQKGWINQNANIVNFMSNKYEVISDAGINISTAKNIDETRDIVIPKGTILTTSRAYYGYNKFGVYGNWYYVKYNDAYGWIKYDGDTLKYLGVATEEETKSEDKQKPVVINKEKKNILENLSSQDIIMIIGLIAIFIFVIVIALCIIKRKSKNK